MKLIFIINMFFLVVSYSTLGEAQEYDHGVTGTVNHDYFNSDPVTQRLRANVDQNHTKPLLQNIRTGDMNRAMAEIKYILDRFPNHASVLTLVTVVAKWTKNSAFGIPYFERATSMFPQYALTHAQYGRYLAEIDQIGAGVGRLKKAVEIDPKLTLAYVWLAAAYSKSGNRDLARQAVEQARSLGYSGKFENDDKLTQEK